MKDVLASNEAVALNHRAVEFSKTLLSMDQVHLRRVLIEDDQDFGAITALVLGLKPVCEFDKPLFDLFRPFEFIPGSLRNEYDVASNSWIYNINLTKQTIKANLDIFTDVNESRLDDNEYLKRYVSRQNALVRGAKKAAVTRTGIILGFPKKSVLEYGRRGQVGYEGFGYAFMASRSDIQPFNQKLERAYQVSGIGSLLEKVNKNVKDIFLEKVKECKPSIGIVNTGRDKILEVKYADVEGECLGIQFGLLTDSSLSTDQVHRLLTFGKARYGLSFLHGLRFRSDGGYYYMGLDTYESLSKLILKQKDKGEFYYVEVQQFALKDLYGIASINRAEMRDFLKNNSKGEFAKLI